MATLLLVARLTGVAAFQVKGGITMPAPPAAAEVPPAQA
jgi:hypothetical protein